MSDFLLEAARAIAASPVNEFVVGALRNVPGLPPMVQTVHILSIAVVLFLSGAVFVIGRPRRYFVNPVFGLKFALLAVAVTATYALQRVQTDATVRGSAKLLAAVSLFSWLGVMLAGRWIAYTDYLFPPE
jgi:hypothetical protein